MPLPSPNLDDRNFEQLLAECRLRLASCQEWTDLSPSDPGIVLLELFAHLTEVMIYRLNRVPEKAYVEFLRLLGVKLMPPSAASVKLRFSVARPPSMPLEIPRATRVTLGRAPGGGEPPVFVTAQVAAIAPGQSQVEVTAYHCELIEGELAGKGSGLPGLSVRIKRPPIVAPLEGHFDLAVGVETLPGELEERAPALKLNGKTFRIWREVEDFVALGADLQVYVVDRMMGVITFAPALRQRSEAQALQPQARSLAAVPPANREIRVWYCRGGGVEGNVAPGMLIVLKEPLAGVQVTNPEPAKGGMAAESLANALARGPLELHSLHRAITARDFETIACRQAGIVARAKAFTKAAIWRHASPGTVSLLLVPMVPEELRVGGRITPEELAAQQTDTARQRIEQALEERRPLGTTCEVDWVRYKEVKVRARLAIHREEDPLAVKARVLQQLHRTISPLPAPEIHSEGWRFGQSLRAFHVYDLILGEPGVSYVEQVRLVVDQVPELQVGALSADPFQPQTWYAASGPALFRSVNDAEGWERLATFAGEEIRAIKNHPDRPGLIALVSQVGGQEPAHRLRYSDDCGESWILAAQTAFTVDDVVWLIHKTEPAVLLAADVGLFELALKPGATPLQILVDPQNQNLGFYALTITDVRGEVWVAAATRAAQGVYLSTQEGRASTFELAGLKGEDVRVLEAQKDGPRRFIWAGTTTPGFEPGKGCLRRELTSDEREWPRFDRGWKGGSCLAMAFAGDQILVATHHAGALWLDTTKDANTAAWGSPEVTSGLPMRDLERFQRINALAANPQASLLLAGGPAGVFCSKDGGNHYSLASGREFVDRVPLPETWLFCSGDHEIVIVNEDEAKRD